MTELKPGDPVLVRACVMARVNYDAVDCLVLKTEYGNRIVEVAARVVSPGVMRVDTGPLATEARVDTGPLATEARVERLARVMAAVDGVEPDQKATIFPPRQSARGWVIDQTMPAWRLYAKYAQALIDAGLARAPG